MQIFGVEITKINIVISSVNNKGRDLPVSHYFSANTNIYIRLTF